MSDSTVADFLAHPRTRRVGWALLGLVLLIALGVVAIWFGLIAWAGLLAGAVLPDSAYLLGRGQQAPRGQLPPRMVPAYNILHLAWLPALPLAVSLFLMAFAATWACVLAFTFGAAWLAHVAFARAVGRTLRLPDGTLPESDDLDADLT